MTTYQLIYSSESTTPMSSDDLEELLQHARSGNGTRGITGALIYADRMFLQILEGEETALHDLMARIKRDVRHENVTVLREGDIPAPFFGSWKMAYVSATREQVAAWAGLRVPTDAPGAAADSTHERQRTAQFAQEILSLVMR